MSERRDSESAEDIREAILRILDYTGGMDYNSFKADRKTQDAVVRNLEIIGEAVKNLSAEYKENRPGIPWKSIASMRDRLIHHYFGVNLDVVWGVIENDLDNLLNNMQIPS